MQTVHHIQFLRNSEVDKERWDECIANAANGLVYARAFYLDSMCKNWSALTGDNYRWVLPLTHNAKWNIPYLYQPPFTQQLGIFAAPDVLVPLEKITRWLQSKYTFWEMNWNYQTDTQFFDPLIEVERGTNFILNLNTSYKNIAAGYHKDLTKNLTRSKRFGLLYRAATDYKNCIALFRQTYAVRLPHIAKGDYSNFARLCGCAHQRNMLVCREVVNQHEDVMATALLLTDGRRLYNLMNTTTEAGRRNEANHFLLDAVIREFSEQNLLFDFEGSDLPGVKTFYQNFGGVNQPYYQVKYNRLPWPIRVFKK